MEKEQLDQQAKLDVAKATIETALADVVGDFNSFDAHVRNGKVKEVKFVGVIFTGGEKARAKQQGRLDIAKARIKTALSDVVKGGDSFDVDVRNGEVRKVTPVASPAGQQPWWRRILGR